MPVLLVLGLLTNQGDALFRKGRLNYIKIVPYCVATYGAVSYRLSTTGAEQANSVDTCNVAKALGR